MGPVFPKWTPIDGRRCARDRRPCQLLFWPGFAAFLDSRRETRPLCLAIAEGDMGESDCSRKGSLSSSHPFLRLGPSCWIHSPYFHPSQRLYGPSLMRDFERSL